MIINDIININNVSAKLSQQYTNMGQSPMV